MTAYFHHEDLLVYQKAITFVAQAEELLQAISVRAAVKDHLKRAAESIPFNIAGGNAQRSADEQRRLIDIANGSAAECAACMDVLRMKHLCGEEPFEKRKKMLLEIAKMLFGLRRSKEPQLLREEPLQYGVPSFGHERLHAYQHGLEVVGWFETFSRSTNLDAPSSDALDRHLTSIPLNVAEGNTKRSSRERGKFFDISISSGLRAASALDVLLARKLAQRDEIQQGKARLAETVSLLMGLQRRAKKPMEVDYGAGD